jgi:hypothetical protein
VEKFQATSSQHSKVGLRIFLCMCLGYHISLHMYHMVGLQLLAIVSSFEGLC